MTLFLPFSNPSYVPVTLRSSFIFLSTLAILTLETYLTDDSLQSMADVRAASGLLTRLVGCSVLRAQIRA